MLDVLKDVGIVTETDLGGGRIIQIDGDILEPLREQLAAQHGFDARLDHFAIFGACRECR